MATISENSSEKQVTVTWKKIKDVTFLGFNEDQVRLSIHVCWWIYNAADSGLRILSALKSLIFSWGTSSVVPLPILKASSDAAKNGIENILYFLAMISINIGIFNLIPIPALDGGKIVLNI